MHADEQRPRHPKPGDEVEVKGRKGIVQGGMVPRFEADEPYQYPVLFDGVLEWVRVEEMGS